MRKILLTVMMVSSLLAFNACSKDGAEGPVGATGSAGPAGPAGPAGEVGPAGAAGADGTKILTGDGAPTGGVNGDYFFDKGGKVLYGPKTDAGWGDGTTLVGATGPTGAAGVDGIDGADGATGAAGADGVDGAAGADGKDGASFLAGAVAPNASIGKDGDYYFNTATSTFIGPKEDGVWGSNSLPLGTAYAAKTYYITPGLTVTEVQSSKTFGEDFSESYSDYNLFSSYPITSNDMIRINQYPGWGDNREMIFESAPGSNLFNIVPTDADDFYHAIDNPTGTIKVGARFRYSNNKTNTKATFTLTSGDIDRLRENGGTGYGYLTYAKIQAPENGFTIGQDLVFAENKNINITPSTNKYSVNYNARLAFNLDALVPNLEKYKQDGIVLVRYKTINPLTGELSNTGADAGWTDMTDYVKSYIIGGVTYGPGQVTVAKNATVANPFPVTSAFSLAPDQNVIPGTISNNNGSFVFDFAISSGNFAAPAATYVGPLTLTNPGNVDDPVANSNDVNRIGRTFETDYYSHFISDAVHHLTSNKPFISDNTINVNQNDGGQPASYFAGKKLVQVQVIVVPGDQVIEAKAKGINLNDANALENFVSKR